MGDGRQEVMTLRSLPSLSMRWVAVWRRNLLVWRKLSIPSLLGNFGDPLLYLLALGYGLGSLVGPLDGMPYITFLASGIVASSAMNTATFEALYSAYTRMTQQQTWAGMLAAPLDVDDIVLGEMIWAGTKSLISAGAILVVASLLGVVSAWTALWVLPVVLLVGICFGAMALVVTAVSVSYEFFLYYFTLVITPMMLFSGVFFPLSRLPEKMQWAVQALPLTHGVSLIRPLVTGRAPQDALTHLLVLVIYAIASFLLATTLLRRRLLA
ncbi:MAG: ABC transporter permease [Candidatus Binatia bacterium]